MEYASRAGDDGEPHRRTAVASTGMEARNAPAQAKLPGPEGRAQELASCVIGIAVLFAVEFGP